MINKFPQHNLKVLGNITGSTLSTSGNVILSTGNGNGAIYLGTGIFILGDQVGSPQPACIHMGSSYATGAGQGLKIKLYENGASLYGFGVSPGTLDYRTNLDHIWWANNNQKMILSDTLGLQVTNLTNSLPVFTNSSNYLVNRGINGSGNVVLASGASLVNPLLTDINGDARVQIYNDASIYLRGVTIVTGYLLVNNQIISEGSSAGLSTYERNGSSKYWTIYSSYGELYFWNAYAGGIHVGTVTSGGNWTIPRLGVSGNVAAATLDVTGSTTLNTVVANTINAGSIVGTTVVGSSIFGYTITGSNILSWGGIYQAYGNAETGYFEAGAPYRYSQGAAYVTGNGDNIGNFFSYRCNFGTYINYSSSGQSGYGFWSNWGYPYMWMEVIHGAHGSWNGLPSDSPIKDTYIYQQIKGPAHNGIGAPVKSTSGNSTFLFGVKGNGDFHVSGNIVGYGLTVTGGLNVGSSIYASSFIATGAGGGLFLRDRSNQNKFFEYYVDNGTLYLGTTENGYQLLSYITSGGSACFARGLTVTGGNITAVGSITASAGYITTDGAAAGFQFADRSDTANRWWWYTQDNVARLYVNSIGDIMSVTNIGGIVFHGQSSFTSSGKTNIRNTTTIQGQTIVSGFFANSGLFVMAGGTESTQIYQGSSGYYLGPQGAVFRLDHTGTHLHNTPAALVIYNASGVNYDWAKLTFAGREPGPGNSVALAGIAVQSHDKGSGNWGHGDFVIWNKAQAAENETVRVVSDGRVGIGTPTPSAHVHVTGGLITEGKVYVGPGVTPAFGKVTISGGGTVAENNEYGALTILGAKHTERLYFGVNSSGTAPYAYIQSTEPGSAQRELKLNPLGGRVSIGNTNTTAPAQFFIKQEIPELPAYERGAICIAGTGIYSRLTLGVDDTSTISYGWIQAIDTTQAARTLVLQPLGTSPVAIGTTGYPLYAARGGLFVTGGGYFGNQVTVSGDVLLGAGSKLRISEVSTHYPVPVLKYRSDQVLVLGNFGGEYQGGTIITEGNMGGNVVVSFTTGHTGLGTAGEFAVAGRQHQGGEDTTATYFKAGQTGVSSLVPFTVTGRLSAGNINSTGAIIATNSYIQARGSNNSIKFEDVNDPSNIWKIHNVDNVTYLNSTSPGNILSITNGGNVGVTGSLTAASMSTTGSLTVGTNLVAPNYITTGTISGSAGIFSSQTLVGTNSLEISKIFEHNLTAGVNDVAYICQVYSDDGAAYIDVSLSTEQGGLSMAYKYLIPVQYNGTNNIYKEVLPIAQNRYYGSEKITLDVSMSNATATLRLRRVAGSTTPALCHTLVRAIGRGLVVATLSTTGVDASVTSKYGSAIITQSNSTVGINTQDATSLLHIVGAGTPYLTDNGIANIESFGRSGLTIGWDYASSSTFLYSRIVGVGRNPINLNSAMYICDAYGNDYVGIGQSNPSQKLDVSGNIRARGTVVIQPVPIVGGYDYQPPVTLLSAYYTYASGSAGTSFHLNTITGGGFNIATTWGAPLTLGAGSSGSTPMNPPNHLVIRNDGCVGIGTYNPSCLLELYGDAPRLKLTDSVNQDWSIRASGHNYYVRDEANGFDPFHLYAGGGFALLGNAGAQVLAYGQSLGQIGLGTSSPQAHLHVTGNILASSLTISGANGYSGVGINCKPINGYALSITGIVSLNYQTVNASSLQFWDSNYGIGMDSGDIVITTNVAQGVSFKTSSVVGTSIGRISAAEAKFPAKAYVAGITTLGSGLDVSGKSHFYTGSRFDSSITTYSDHVDGYGNVGVYLIKHDNLASFSYSHWDKTGIIDIKMPLGFSPPADANVMGCFIVEGQTYDGNGAWKLYAYGYNYQEGYWVNASARVEGYTPFTTVRFSMLNGTGHLLIGETGTHWVYPQFRLGFMQGHNTQPDYATGWNISMITGLGSMSGITNAPLYASRTYNDGNHHFHKINVATSLTVNGNSVVSGNSTTYGTIYAYNNLLTSAGNLSLVPGAGALFLDTTLSNDIFFRPNSIAVATLGLDGQFKCKHGFFTGNVAVTGQLSVTGAVIGSSYIKTQGTSNGFYFEDINDPANSWRLYNVDNITYLKSASPGNVFSVSSAGAVTTSGSLTVTGVNVGAHISSASVHGVGTVVGTTESQSLTNKTITGRSNFNMATHLVTTSGGNYIALTGNVAIYAGQVLYSATTGQALWKTLAKSFGGSTSINLNGTANVTTNVSTSVDMAQAYITVTSTESDPGVAQALFSVNNKTNGAFDINATSLNNTTATIGVDWMAIINEP